MPLNHGVIQNRVQFCRDPIILVLRKDDRTSIPTTMERIHNIWCVISLLSVRKHCANSSAKILNDSCATGARERQPERNRGSKKKHYHVLGKRNPVGILTVHGCSTPFLSCEAANLIGSITASGLLAFLCAENLILGWSSACAYGHPTLALGVPTTILVSRPTSKLRGTLPLPLKGG